MLSREENRYNEARTAFDIAYADMMEAINFYNDAWFDSERERAGLTPENFEKLLTLSKDIKTGIPQRGVILDSQRAKATVSVLEETASNATSSNNSMLPKEKENFLTIITKNIRRFFDRIRNRNIQVENVPETIEQADADITTEIDDGLTDLFREEDGKTFDVDKIIEDCTRAYEELSKRSRILDDIYEKRINETPTGKVVDTKREGPGILDDYRQASWGIERICLDGFQNHLPTDSKGSQCYLHFKVGNKWVDLETARLHRDQIREVRFSDNGVGFTADNLFYLHSTKTSEDSSVGQFGEGMKLASIAAVNLGLGLEFQSRNWTAIATSEEKKLINTRNNDSEETRKKLVYDVKVYDGEPIIGSRTIFHTPTPEFIEYALKLPEKIMGLGKIKPQFVTDEVDIIDFEQGGKAFVKGVYLRDIGSFFSYNFKNANVNPDRNDFHAYYLRGAITGTIAQLRDVDMIEKFLIRMLEYTKEKKIDNKQYNPWAEHPIEFLSTQNIIDNIEHSKNREEISNLWKTAFERALLTLGITSKDGIIKKPVLETDYEAPEYLRSTLDDYAVIKLAEPWTKFFAKIGIPTDRDIIPEFIEEKVETSLSLDYGSQIWDTQRIMLDAAQNHLPSDSKGSTVFLRFQTKDGKWHDYREFDQFSDSEIGKIKISDDGIGYDSKNLGLFASIKDHSGSSGKWGEGLKMLSAAALRAGVQMELRSRDWIAIPETKTEIINEGQQNEKSINRLVYTIRKRIDPQSNVLDDGDNETKGDYGFTKDKEVSSTTFINPSPELIKEFRSIRDSILLFSPRTPIATAKESEVLATSGGKLFVRNILIPGEHQLKYTYHLKDFDIETRDRDVIKKDSMTKKMKEILENVDNERFIIEFLSDAAGNANGFKPEDFIEFLTSFDIPAKTELADKWIQAFKKKFGERTSIRAAGDINFNAVHQAQHMGIDIVTLPNAVARSLSKIVGRDGQKIASYQEALRRAIENTVPIREEELTEYEKNMITHLYNYNKILEIGGHGRMPIERIQVYDYPEDYVGDRAGGFAGAGNVMNISRDTLNNGIIEAGHVFFHESGHAITGAEDADAVFRDYLSRLLSSVASRIFPLQDSIHDNGIASDISITDINNALNMLKIVVSKDEAETGPKETGEEFGEQ